MIKNPNYVYGPTELNVPVRLNFGDYMVKKLLEWNEKIAVINAATDEQLSYRQIAQDAMNLAVSLTRLGVRKGDVIALCSENQQNFLSAVVGSTCTGAALTTINVGYTKDELKHVMSISKPKHIICSEFAYQNYKDVIKAHHYVKNVIVFGAKHFHNTLSYNELITPSPNNSNGLTKNVSYSEFEAVDVQGQTDTLFILYSSGTTGLPKGVMLTHLNVLTVCCPDQIGEEPIPITVAPWYHVMGLISAVRYMALGWTVVYLSKFDMKLFLDTIVKYKVSQLTVVPTVLVGACKFNSQHDLSCVKQIYSGAAPLHKDTLGDVQQKFPNVKTVLQGYGMTETTFTVTKDTDDTNTSKAGGVGPVLMASTMKVEDPDTRKPLGPNEQGEICVKGPLIMKGYIGKDKREDFDEEGFFKTGDIGYYDKDGYFYVVDRLKEVIKYKGYQVPPAEIEAVLLQHEAVRDAGVVGIEHKKAGEVPLAFVALQPGKNITVKELQDFVAKRLSDPKHLRGGVQFVNEIPRNPSGKILRRQLRSMAKERKSKL